MNFSFENFNMKKNYGIQTENTGTGSLKRKIPGKILAT